MSDNNASSNKKTRKFLKWKEKKDRGRNMQNAFNNTASTHEHHDRPHYNGAIFRSPCTSKFNAVFRPQVSAFYPAAASTSQSNAALHSQVSSRCSTTQQNSKPTTSAHNLPSFAARGGPPHGHPRTFMNSKRDSPSAVAGSSGQSSGQRTSSTFTATQKSLKYLAIDCEMVGTGPKGQISQLARCSIVSYDGDVVFDKFIRPTQPVTDYRTRWSGIRSYDLIRATPYTQARKEILKLLMGKVLVGHAIHNDLKVLSYCHPKALIRDTSRIPLLNTKAGFPENQVISLKRLTKALLNRDIQTGTKGHSSVEDAKATMDLYKVVEVEWERSLASTTKTDGSLLEK